MEKTKKARIRDKRDPEQTEAWILGTGTASLASASYLIKHAKVPPQKVHILESRDSLQEIWHHKGDPSSGYDQFGRCLPVPIGEPLKEILSCIPSAFPTTGRRAQSFLHAIQSAEVNRTFSTQAGSTCIVVQRDRKLQNIVTGSLDLNLKQRLNLVRLMLKGEKRLGRNHISDFFPQSFFETSFWAIWSAQFGLQPWHSATEFRRALRHYLGDFHNLSFLNCLDITGYYQFESIFLPICLFLESLDVDFQFDTKVRAIVTTSDNDSRTISRLELSQNGFLTRKDLGPHDIVIATLGSTESGTAVGSNDHQLVMLSFDACDQFDENWSLWLTLAPVGRDFGNPYTFCTRRPQSMVESFTITTEELNFFNYLTSLSQSTLATGALIVLRESQWKLNLCIPAQPVFQYQPEDVRVLWGFALFPEGIGDYVKKPMLQCSGAEIMTELLKHLNYPSELVFRHTVNIPRVMPRMSAIFLAHSRDERPDVVPRNTSNIGLVGQFVEIPQYSCIDMSYAARSAQMVVSGLMGIDIPSAEVRRSLTALLIRILLWK